MIRKPQTERSTRPGSEDSLRRLLTTAGPLPDISAEDMARMRATARREWLKAAAERRRQRFPRILQLAAAAALALALGLVWHWTTRTAPSGNAAVATVELISGDAWLEGPGAAFEPGGSLTAGTELVTGSGEDGRRDVAAVRLAGGQSVRLDSASRLRLTSPSRLELLAGAVYVDSGEAGAGVEITTRYGRVLDVGTQFEVRLAESDSALVVRVRRGAVSLHRDRRETASAEAGEVLLLLADGSLERSAATPFDPAWEWVLAATPAFAIEGRSLADFLAWLERETGWRVAYEPQDLATSADSIRLHGSIDGLRPDEAPAAVLPGCGLESRLADGVLTITAATGS